MRLSKIFEQTGVNTLIFIVISLFLFSNSEIVSQQGSPSAVDEYSVLDANIDKTIDPAIEKSRQMHKIALNFIELKDTAKAKEYFLKAAEELNAVSDLQGIERVEEYTDIVIELVEDYKSFIGEITGNEAENPIAALKNKFYEKKSALKSVKINKLDSQKQEKPIAVEETTENHAGESPKTEVNKENKIPILSKESKPTFPRMGSVRTEIPLDENDIVMKSIKFYTEDKGRRWIKVWLQRSTKWFPMMRRIAREEGMPEELAFISMIESGLKPDEKSHAKAVGQWQFMWSTGLAYGLNDPESVWIDERRDPEKSARAAMRHFRDLYFELGDWHLALAAYNCGIGCVKRAIKRSKIENPSFWEIRDYLPWETKNYVPLFIATTKIGLDPEAYGFYDNEMEYQDELLYDTHTLTEPVSLKAIAKCAEVSIEEIQALNPELLKGYTPPDRNSYTIKLPYGSRQKFLINFAGLSAEDKIPWFTHKVKRKESLKSIAKDYGISKQELMSANDITNSRKRLSTGTVLTIPVDKYLDEAYNKLQISEDEEPSYGAYTLHRVKNGESLYSISQKYGVRLYDLRKINRISYDEDKIPHGTKIKIPVMDDIAKKTDPKPKKSSKARIVKHVVQRGESLAQLADDYDINIDELRQLNNMDSNRIFKGKIMKIKTFLPERRKSSKPRARLYTSKKKKKKSKTVASKRKSSKSSKKRVYHKVRKGESISSIAQKYGVSEKDIKRWNRSKVKGESTIYKGTKLKIYPKKFPKKKKTVKKTSKSKPKSKSSKTKKKKKRIPKYYRIKRGDTLGKIAQKYGVSVKQLKKKNRNLKPNKMRIGKKIRLR